MNRKRIILSFLCAALLLSGLGLLLYSPWKTAKRAEAYRQEIACLESYFRPDDVFSEKNQEAARPFSDLWDACEAYNRLLLETNQESISVRTMEDAPVRLADYGWQAEAFGYLSIPAIDLEAPIYLGASEENLERGGAVVGQTSLPIGGENTHCTIAGHRSWRGAVLFRPVEKLLPGDLVLVTNPWETLTYEVVEIKVVEAYETQEILIQPGRDLLTLLTCAYPNDRRVLVLCEREETVS